LARPACETGYCEVGGIVSTNIDFERINNAIIPNAVSYLRQWLPDGKLNGKEFLARNPRRADDNIGSFNINTQTGEWGDFAIGQAGGDFVSLYAYINNISQSAAAKALSSENFTENVPKPNKQSKNAGLDICLPIPENIPNDPTAPKVPVFPKVFKIGEKFIEPSRIYRYNNSDGQAMCYICRFNPTPENGLEKKEIRPITLWKDKNGKYQWKYRHIEKDRPLYGLDYLENAGNGKSKVLVVSGEKCVDACRYFFNKKYENPTQWNYIPVTWAGGDQGTGKTDFTPLMGRDLVWWADNDISSKTCMQKLADNLGGIVLNIDSGKHEKGWDCADAVIEGIDLEAFIATNEKPKYADMSIVAPMDIFPHISEKGKIKGTIENIRALLKYYGLKIIYNQISKDYECFIQGVKYESHNFLNAFYSIVKSLCALNEIPAKDSDRFVDRIAAENIINPVVEWVDSRKWDGKNRLQQLYDSIVCNEKKITKTLKEVLIRKWLISAVAAAYRRDGDNFKYEGVLVFHGEQKIGKTTFFKNLVGEKWGGNANWFGDGKTLNAENKDSVLIATSYWITELGELENTTKHSVAALKSFITSSSDKLRTAYERKPTIFWRRTVFGGTVNLRNFLPDPTGNRRFWVLPVLEFKDISDVDMQQVWAQVKALYDAKNIWWLTDGEGQELDTSNEEFRQEDTVEHLLSSYLDWNADKEKWSWRQPAIILIECGIKEPKPPQNTRVGIFLSKKLGETYSKRTGDGRFWLVPPRVSSGGGGYNDDGSVYRGGF